MPTDIERVIRAELNTRLLARPHWHPSPYDGRCVVCEQPVKHNDPIILVKSPRGPRWVCSCAFLPGQPLDAKLGYLRAA